MPKLVRLSFLILLITIISASAVWAEAAEQSVTRMFSYDPHPSSLRFTEKVPFNGKMHDFEIVFVESWQASGENGTLKQISFKIQVMQGDQIVASSDTAPFSAAKMSKGQQIGNVKIGDTSFTANITDIVKNKAGITDLTVNFRLSYEKIELEATEEQSAATTPAFTAFRPADPTGVIALPEQPSKAVTSEVSVDAATPVSEKKAPVPTPRVSVPEEAVTLYKQARTMFAQSKGPEGREALRKALEIAPAYHDALILLGDNASENRRWARAKEAFKKALDVVDRDADTLLKYFKASYYMGEGADAILFLEQIRSKHPDERRITLNVAEAQFQLGDLPAAKTICEEMLAKNPDDRRASDLLQRVNRLHK